MSWFETRPISDIKSQRRALKAVNKTESLDILIEAAKKSDYSRVRTAALARAIALHKIDEQYLIGLANDLGNYYSFTHAKIAWNEIADTEHLWKLANSAEYDCDIQRVCDQLYGHDWGECVCKRCGYQRSHHWDENNVCRLCGKKHVCEYERVYVRDGCGVCRTCTGGGTNDWGMGDCDGEPVYTYVCKICGK